MIGLLRRAWRHIGLVLELGGYAAWLLVDIAATSTISGGLNLVAGVLVAGITLLRRRPGGRLDRVAAAALGMSIAISALSFTLHLLYPPQRFAVDLSFAEDLALAIVVVQVLRRLPLRSALILTGVAAVAIVATAAARILPPDLISVFATLCALGWGGSVAIGLVLGEVDTRRRTALDDVRTGERMELARELHDVVAHQVTGIVVAAQAAAVVARTSPDEVDRALAAIEAAGTDALATMRRMVGALRGQDGARTKLTTDAGWSTPVLPAGVAATGYRVVQAALTNVRRHAAEASVVEVDVRIREETLLVTVRNDATSTGPQVPRGGSGGFGLAGMAERVAALDGELTAGPAGPGVWAVAARLRLRGAAGGWKPTKEAGWVQE